jgi:hypothetical protein
MNRGGKETNVSMRRVDPDTRVSMSSAVIGVRALRDSAGIIGRVSIGIGLSGNGIGLN